MKKIVFLIIVISIMVYDVYQVNSYYETKKNIEKNIEKKSNNVANIVKLTVDHVGHYYNLEDALPEPYTVNRQLESFSWPK